MQYVEHIATLAWQVLLFGILLGAGLPALFALGVRALTVTPATARAEGDVVVSSATTVRPGPGRIVLGVACFAVMVAAVVVGIVYLVATGHR